MTVTAGFDFQQARSRWLTHVAGMVHSPRADRFGTALEVPCSDLERALVVVHVGLTHLMGGDRDDAALADFCSPSEADSIIGDWRSAGQSAHVVGEIVHVWHALWRVGASTQGIRAELDAFIADGYLARTLRAGRALDDELDSAWAGLSASGLPDRVEIDPIWDCPGSHLERIREAGRPPQDLWHGLSPLERRALIGARRHPHLEDAYARTISVVEVWHSMQGGWGGPAPTDVPSWWRDMVVRRGGRQLQDRAGAVPCWFVVAESVDELRAYAAWQWSDAGIGIGYDRDARGDVILQIQLPIDDGGPPGFVEFRYPTAYLGGATSLDMLAWVGIIRLEVYEVVDSELRFAFSRGVRLPDLRSKLTDAEIRQFPAYNWLEHHEPTADDVLDRMRNAERVQFELVRRGEAARNSEPSERVATAYDAYLRRLDEGGSAAHSGLVADEAAIDRARRELRLALSYVENPADAIALDLLGPDRAYANVQLIESEPARVTSAVAYPVPDGVDATELTLCVQDYENGGLVADDEAWQEFSGLPFTRVLVSPSGPLYALPIHEDFLEAGLEQVSYAHRVAILSTAPPRMHAAQEILLAGWSPPAGSRDHLPCLDLELSALEGIYGQTRRELVGFGVLPAVVHLAGHGDAGSRAVDYWLRASSSADHLVTPARVLLDVDASETELVYLSACSTGRGEFGSRTIMDAIPLDVAFLERGATCVLSTSAPVNDSIATIFAISFHAAWRIGASIWDAYTEARAVIASGSASGVVANILDENWERWREALMRGCAAEPESWMLFRLSGRHW